MALYNLKSADGDYIITKFDNELNVESSYTTTFSECTCPAGSRPSCRHRQMLPKMLHVDACDQPLFYNFEADKFYEQQAADQSPSEPTPEIRGPSSDPSPNDDVPEARSALSTLSAEQSPETAESEDKVEPLKITSFAVDSPLISGKIERKV